MTLKQGQKNQQRVGNAIRPISLDRDQFFAIRSGNIHQPHFSTETSDSDFWFDMPIIPRIGEFF